MPKRQSVLEIIRTESQYNSTTTIGDKNDAVIYGGTSFGEKRKPKEKEQYTTSPLGIRAI